ncbi:CD225/dispanin family protein [Rhodococcus sp. SGAir0479]|uniref:CD225/dispanin family protein n=1 Tax=Rhodococcus sp. SGAir0479 TaxID=2567884 RepID=UPI0010CD1349|nr:CD225/dispanin family protein [Rhodococcus sp. SGAir0479]QCQ90208.1 CD225/dispanin family protein [Rhodococcus sp. SGAir0479]
MTDPNFNAAPTGAPNEPWAAGPGYAPQPYANAPQYPAGPLPQYGGQAPLPPSNAGWAVATIIFFWPLAFAAFNHLHSIFPKWSMGDYMGAQYASERVKALGKIALWLFVGLLVLYVIFMIIVLVAAANDVSSSSTYYR